MQKGKYRLLSLLILSPRPSPVKGILALTLPINSICYVGDVWASSDVLLSWEEGGLALLETRFQRLYQGLSRRSSQERHHARRVPSSLSPNRAIRRVLECWYVGYMGKILSIRCHELSPVPDRLQFPLAVSACHLAYRAFESGYSLTRNVTSNVTY